jgi:hypothetical protein
MMRPYTVDASAGRRLLAARRLPRPESRNDGPFGPLGPADHGGPSDHAEAQGKRAGQMVDANLDLLAVGVRRCRGRESCGLGDRPRPRHDLVAMEVAR